MFAHIWGIATLKKARRIGNNEITSVLAINKHEIIHYTHLISEKFKKQGTH